MWLDRMRAMTHANIWILRMIKYDSMLYLTWLTPRFQFYAWYDSILYVTWLIQTSGFYARDMIRFYIWHDSSKDVNCMRDMTRSYAWHDLSKDSNLLIICCFRRVERKKERKCGYTEEFQKHIKTSQTPKKKSRRYSGGSINKCHVWFELDRSIDRKSDQGDLQITSRWVNDITIKHIVRKFCQNYDDEETITKLHDM